VAKNNRLLVGLFVITLAILGCRLGGLVPTEAARQAPPVGLTPEPEALPAAGSPSPGLELIFVRLEPGDGNLGELLAAEAANAEAQGLKPFVEFDATWCIHCKELDASLSDLRMLVAFRGTYIIRVDIDDWDGQFTNAGFHVFGVPAFYAIDGAGKPTGRMITGGAWDANIPENMAGPLSEFFAGE